MRDWVEEKIDEWTSNYCSQFIVAFGRDPEGYPYNNSRVKGYKHFDKMKQGQFGTNEQWQDAETCLHSNLEGMNGAP